MFLEERVYMFAIRSFTATHPPLSIYYTIRSFPCNEKMYFLTSSLQPRSYIYCGVVTSNTILNMFSQNPMIIYAVLSGVYFPETVHGIAAELFFSTTPPCSVYDLTGIFTVREEYSYPWF